MSVNASHIRALDELIIRHPRFLDVEDKMLEYIELAADNELFMLLGPTGSGKTTTIDAVDVATRPGENEISSMGLVCVRAPAPDQNGFPFKSFYHLSLSAMGEFAVDKRVAYDADGEGAQLVTASDLRKANTHDTGKLLEQALRDRSPTAFVVDECQHIGASPTNRVKAGNLDVIKEHKSYVDTPLILVGTYQAQEMLCYTGQMSRRMRTVNFDPYYPNTEDIKVFAHIIDAIIEKIDIPVSFSVAANQRKFHQYSVGCVGIFISWFRYALTRAKRRNRSKLTLEEMWSTRHTEAEVATIAAEIDDFEEFNERRRQFLGGGSAGSKRRKRTNRNSKPGRPNPKRFPGS